MANASLEKHLRELEERLLQTEVRKSPEELDQLLADDFVEIGSSGRLFNKQQIIEGLINETPVHRTLLDFKIKLLAPDVALVTYRVHNHEEQRYSLQFDLETKRRPMGKWSFIKEPSHPHRERLVGCQKIKRKRSIRERGSKPWEKPARKKIGLMTLKKQHHRSAMFTPFHLALRRSIISKRKVWDDGNQKTNKC
jgi:hypothetical protein